MSYEIDKAIDYSCSVCGLTNVKLWRQYNTMACYLELKCAACASDQTVDEDGGSSSIIKDINGKVIFDQKTDQLETKEDGSLVPAIPTADGTETYWGYSSVPIGGVIWWKALPTYEGQQRDYKKLIFRELDRTESSASKYFLRPVNKILASEIITDEALNACKEMIGKESLYEPDYMDKLFSNSIITLLEELTTEERSEWLNDKNRANGTRFL